MICLFLLQGYYWIAAVPLVVWGLWQSKGTWRRVTGAIFLLLLIFRGAMPEVAPFLYWCCAAYFTWYRDGQDYLREQYRREWE